MPYKICEKEPGALVNEIFEYCDVQYRLGKKVPLNTAIKKVLEQCNDPETIRITKILAFQRIKKLKKDRRLKKEENQLSFNLPKSSKPLSPEEQGRLLKLHRASAPYYDD